MYHVEKSWKTNALSSDLFIFFVKESLILNAAEISSMTHWPLYLSMATKFVHCLSKSIQNRVERIELSRLFQIAH